MKAESKDEQGSWINQWTVTVHHALVLTKQSTLLWCTCTWAFNHIWSYLFEIFYKFKSINTIIDHVFSIELQIRFGFCYSATLWLKSTHLLTYKYMYTYKFTQQSHKNTHSHIKALEIKLKLLIPLSWRPKLGSKLTALTFFCKMIFFDLEAMSRIIIIIIILLLLHYYYKM